MSFHTEASKEERREWRSHPVTRLALEMLRDEAKAFERAVAVAAGANAPDGSVKVLAGKVAGLWQALDLLESER